MTTSIMYRWVSVSLGYFQPVVDRADFCYHDVYCSILFRPFRVVMAVPHYLQVVLSPTRPGK